jgi:hypothetical protein
MYSEGFMKPQRRVNVSFFFESDFDQLEGIISSCLVSHFCNGLLDNLWCRKPMGRLPHSSTHEWYSPGCGLRCGATCASGVFQSENQQSTLRKARVAMSVRRRQAGAHRGDEARRCYHQGAHIRARMVCCRFLFYFI